RPLVTHHQVKDGSVSRIPANQTMAPETPNIPYPRDSGRWIIGGQGDLILDVSRIVRRALARFVEHEVDFGGRETGELDIEIDVDEALQLDRQELSVPARVEGELVVGQHIGPPLARIQMSQDDGRSVSQ